MSPTAQLFSSRQHAMRIILKLRQSGFVAYFAGGCVRDQLLGLPPSDYDVATNATPTQVRQLFRRTQAVGHAFGVVLVREHTDVVEVSTFRSDGRYVDGRRPSQVTFSTPQHDARRRDFTINGLFIDPHESDPSLDRVIDFVGGECDLRQRVIRAIGNPAERFAEDHLRMIRAVRFAARLNFTIDPDTASAIRSHAPKLARISPERVGDEVRRILQAPTCAVAQTLLHELGLLDVLMRHVPKPNSTPTSVPNNPLENLLPQVRVGTFGAALAALWFDHIAAPLDPLWVAQQFGRAARGIRQTLRLSNEETEQFVGAMAFVPLLVGEFPAVARLKRFLAGPLANDAQELLVHVHLVDASLPRQRQLLEQLRQLHALGDFAQRPLITGNDLIELGYSPGPAFKRALDAAYDAQLERRVTTKSQAIALARQALEDEPA